MSVLPKFLANAPTSTIANLFKEDDKVKDPEGVAALVKKSLDEGDYARVSIKTGRRIG